VNNQIRLFDFGQEAKERVGIPPDLVVPPFAVVASNQFDEVRVLPPSLPPPLSFNLPCWLSHSHLPPPSFSCYFPPMRKSLTFLPSLPPSLPPSFPSSSGEGQWILLARARLPLGHVRGLLHRTFRLHLPEEAPPRGTSPPSLPPSLRPIYEDTPTNLLILPSLPPSLPPPPPHRRLFTTSDKRLKTDTWPSAVPFTRQSKQQQQQRLQINDDGSSGCWCLPACFACGWFPPSSWPWRGGREGGREGGSRGSREEWRGCSVI